MLTTSSKKGLSTTEDKMNLVTVSLLLVLFLGAGSCQELDAGSTEEDSLEVNESPYPIKLEMMCPDLEKDEHTSCSNDTEGVPITLPGQCERGQTCRFRLFACPRTFHKAWCHCRSIRGKLVTIPDARQNRRILQTVRYQNSGVSQVWIGLRKPCGAYQYSYIDGSPCKYSNWACGQPLRYGNMCAVLCIQSDSKKKNSEAGKWRSLTCNARVPFICRV